MKGDAAAFALESGAWGLQGCTQVRLSAVDEDALGEALTLAWQNAVDRKVSRRSKATRKPLPLAKAGRRGKK